MNKISQKIINGEIFTGCTFIEIGEIALVNIRIPDENKIADNCP